MAIFFCNKNKKKDQLLQVISQYSGSQPVVWDLQEGLKITSGGHQMVAENKMTHCGKQE